MEWETDYLTGHLLSLDTSEDPNGWSSLKPTIEHAASFLGEALPFHMGPVSTI